MRLKYQTSLAAYSCGGHNQRQIQAHFQLFEVVQEVLRGQCFKGEV